MHWGCVVWDDTNDDDDDDDRAIEDEIGDAAAVRFNLKKIPHTYETHTRTQGVAHINSIRIEKQADEVGAGGAGG